ncbi:MAG: hypothetical protein QMD94_01120 [Candidatus Omnitrophota bacterium]|nr:hypothetical protein [Candidatus Omnitrophota bacterium]
MKQFDDFNATYLYCNKPEGSGFVSFNESHNCNGSMPVREKLLLILPDGYLFEYLCVNCGETVGDKKTKLNPEDKVFLR